MALAGKSKQTKKGMKDIPGKGATSKRPNETVYKPSLWLDGKQVPKELANAKPGDKVAITMQAKVTRVSQSIEGGNSVSVELDKMAVDKTKK